MGQTDKLNVLLSAPIPTSIIKGAWVEIRPTNSVEDDTPADFEISGGGPEYLDLANMFIKAINSTDNYPLSTRFPRRSTGCTCQSSFTQYAF